MKRVQLWSSGGGTQSAAIAALIVEGRLRPDAAVIVDTEREQSTTWEYHDKVIVPALARVGVTLHRVRKSQYEWRDLYGGADNETLLLPVFTTQGGDVGKLPTYCSSYWKREVVKRWANEQGFAAIDKWIGYSIDEDWRVRSRKAAGKWQERYPLIELGMNRGDCEALVLRVLGKKPPRSSCWMCPNHTQQEWREIRERPSDWAKVVQFDRELRARDPHAWLHPDCVPIDQANLDDANGVLFEEGRGCASGLCFN